MFYPSLVLPILCNSQNKHGPVLNYLFFVNNSGSRLELSLDMTPSHLQSVRFFRAFRKLKQIRPPNNSIAEVGSGTSGELGTGVVLPE